MQGEVLTNCRVNEWFVQVHKLANKALLFYLHITFSYWMKKKYKIFSSDTMERFLQKTESIIIYKKYYRKLIILTNNAGLYENGDCQKRLHKGGLYVF